ncbi:parallel beta-helix domain-containing protein [Halalkalibaculum roseum]|nr:parallel beta-helix domain-containing protein [Halalkalibaculum roseum]
MKTNMNKRLGILTVLSLIILASGCKEPPPCDFEIRPGPAAQNQMQTALNQVKDGCTISLSDGVFEFSRGLTMDSKSNVTIKGVSRENTILSFENQETGADGLLISNSDDIIVKDLTIRDTMGDALKFTDSQSIVMLRLNTIWSGEPSEDNGAYGLYPVESSNILIDDCYSYGASDSGIYVGQSDNAIVRNSRAEGNVIGIEIENTTGADVYDNVVYENAAGIMVINLPGLSQLGSQTRIFNNTITDNNLGNFAHHGHIAAEVPAGTGILTLSITDVEIFNNDLHENNVVGTAVASYLALVGIGVAPEPTDPNYNPYPGNIYIHDNSYSRSNNYAPAEEQSDFGNLLVQSFGANPIPDFILDGIFLPESGESGTICIENNDGSSFVNLNLLNDFPNNLSFDASPHACSMDPLPEIVLDIPQI